MTTSNPTLQDVITRARRFLQDTIPPYRNEDDELEELLFDAFGQMYVARPDIFPAPTVICDSKLPVWTDLNDPFPLKRQWVLATALYVAALAETKDDEHTASGKAGGMLAQARISMGIAV